MNKLLGALLLATSLLALGGCWKPYFWEPEPVDERFEEAVPDWSNNPRPKGLPGSGLDSRAQEIERNLGYR